MKHAFDVQTDNSHDEFYIFWNESCTVEKILKQQM